MKRIGVLVSHRGTNFQAIIDACIDGRINAEIVVAISNNSKSEGLQRAKKANINTAHLSSVTHPDPAALDSAMLMLLNDHKVDMVVTAGYMKKLGPRTLKHYSGRILNVHPSLLPKYGGKGMFGMNVHKAVILAGDSETGITIHWLDEEYDTGPIISQEIIKVQQHDTAESLADRMLNSEHELLVATLADLTTGDKP